jgi:hypothetical protein
MQDVSNLFWNSSLEEIKKGYTYDFPSGVFTCLICGEEFEKGRIYPSEGLLFEAEKAVAFHVKQRHSSVFSFLTGMDKKYTGLTEHQKMLLNLFYQGASDKDIAAQLGGSSSTVRNHRFNFREKEKEAKITLAILQLLNEQMSGSKGSAAKFIEPHEGATMVDDRYLITEEESNKILKLYFKEGLTGPLSHFPTKEKRKLIILRHLIKRFTIGKAYSEKEVNETIMAVYDDYVTVRRYFIEYGFMERIADGSSYWVKAGPN